MGIGEASGMFPIDINNKNYNKDMIEKFDSLIASKEYSWSLEEILPKVLVAGEEAGVLTKRRGFTSRSNRKLTTRSKALSSRR